jgi:hypothetical protein
MLVLFFVFLMGLAHQKANFSLFPSSGTGSLLNVVFLVALGLVFFMLLQFFISWTFIETVQWFVLASSSFLTKFCHFRWLRITPSSISSEADVVILLGNMWTLLLNHFQARLMARLLSMSFFITFATAISKSYCVTWMRRSLNANIPASVHTAFV